MKTGPLSSDRVEELRRRADAEAELMKQLMFEAVLKLPEGRAFIGQYLAEEKCLLSQSISRPNGSEQSNLSGRRDVAVQVMREAALRCPQLFFQMTNERGLRFAKDAELDAALSSENPDA